MKVDDAKLGEVRRWIGRMGAAPQATKMADEDRVAGAKEVFRRRINAENATYLETCIHCGMCAEVCHFYEATGDGKYTPIHKVEPMRRFYQREMGSMGWLRRLVTRDITAKDLEDWQELAFDSCTQCGRCDMVCPMGIYISPMIGIMREALAAVGLQPTANRALVHEMQDSGTLLGIGPQSYRQAAAELAEQGIDVPLDAAQADVVVLMSAMDAALFKNAIGATATILNKLKLHWTISTDAGDAAAFDWTSGDEVTRVRLTRRIVEHATALGAKTVIVPECGHGYAALRWGGANSSGKPLPFEVIAISEFIGREIEAGRLKVKPIVQAGTVTYHDPCKVGRWSGVFDEPRSALEALGLEVVEMESHARTNFCCGGGGGVLLNERAAKLRAGAFHIKMREVDATGATAVVTGCGHCRMTFLDGAERANWQTPVESLVELVAAHLAD
jgi:Fe-S oxidoreductase